MEDHADKCVERNCELAKKKCLLSSKLLHHAQMITKHFPEDFELSGELCSNCSEMLVFGKNWTTMLILVSLILWHDQQQRGAKLVTKYC